MSDSPQRIVIDTEHIFKYHPPSSAQIEQYEAIRKAAREFADILAYNTPACADQTAAIRKLRECVMTANAGIALNVSF